MGRLAELQRKLLEVSVNDVKYEAEELKPFFFLFSK
jgi:hypothetical protein